MTGERAAAIDALSATSPWPAATSPGIRAEPRLEVVSAKQSMPVGAVYLTGTQPDRRSHNANIRRYVADAFRNLYPAATIVESTLERSAGKIAEQRYDLILGMGSLAIEGHELYLLRQAADRAKCPLALWLTDDPYEFDYAYRAEAVADVILTNDSWAALHYRHDQVFHLPLAGCRPTYLRRADGRRRDIDLFFCGHAHNNRIAFFRDAATLLAKARVSVFGSGWPDDIRCARNARLSPAAIADFATRATLTLNIGREGNIANRRLDLPPASPGPRTFEIALAGSAQVHASSGLEMIDYFSAGSEIVLIDGARDLADMFVRARDEPEYFERIAANAQRRALRDHCYEHRVARLVEIMSSFSGRTAAPELRSAARSDLRPDARNDPRHDERARSIERQAS